MENFSFDVNYPPICVPRTPTTTNDAPIQPGDHVWTEEICTSFGLSAMPFYSANKTRTYICCDDKKNCNNQYKIPDGFLCQDSSECSGDSECLQSSSYTSGTGGNKYCCPQGDAKHTSWLNPYDDYCAEPQYKYLSGDYDKVDCLKNPRVRCFSTEAMRCGKERILACSVFGIVN